MNYYEILGIPGSASTKEIKTAFRRLARQYHPDFNGNSQENLDKFRQICLAYEVLSDSQQRRDYDRILELDRPQSYNTLYSQGLNHAQHKNYPAAIDHYTRALKIDPRQWQLYLKRAEAYYRIYNYGNVLEDCRQVLQLNPTCFEAYYYLGLSRQRLGYTQSAIEAYGRGISLKPDYAPAYYARGLALSELHNYQRAIQDLEKAAVLFAKTPGGNRDRIIGPKLKNLRKKQLQGRKQSLTAFLSLVPGVVQNLLSSVYVMVINPKDGLGEQFLKIAKNQTLSIGILSMVLTSIVLVFTWLNWGNKLPVLILFCLGLVPSILLILSSYLVRITWQFYGYLEGDIFMGGLIMLPVSVVLLITSSLEIANELKMVIILIAIFHLTTITYNNYLQISNFTKPMALLMTPVILTIIFPVIWSIYYYF
ncbi:MAG: Chaperone protein DnaJ [Chroococcopsis gigantea SAG 12.99]|jgi:tetratricopeptide (TPR) repeat protein|nr:DnaJ domain-containing protein [Chlorogloea purpurea SAG 13.99]MDV3001614.1 Chaperone protein DnaJ [Chroococcopsis gigantea SAG 12.99]